MTMLSLTGTVANVVVMPARTDKKTGEAREAFAQVQLMCRETMQDGQERLFLHTLSTDTPERFKPHQGRSVRVPVGVYVKAGSIAFYMTKGGSIEPVADAA